MTVEELKELKPEEVKQLLSTYKISARDIANSLNISHPVVVDVINNKYNGSKDTINKVWERIAFVLQHKEDLNPVIYNNADTFIKLLSFAIKHKSFDDDETTCFIELKKTITNYKKNSGRN